MFVRNNTTCPFCGKCNTYDLAVGSGVFHNDDKLCFDMSVKCISCGDLIRCIVHPEAIFELIKLAVKTLPEEANWTTQFKHLPSYDTLFGVSYRETCEFVAACGFIRNYADVHLTNNLYLREFVGLILARYYDGEYYDSVVYIYSFGLTAGRPLAS